MKKIYSLGILIVFLGCTETEFDKVTFPTTGVAGEYVTELELAALEITDVQNIRIYNTAFSTDSLWVEDASFFETQVRVKYDGNNKFSVINGVDIFSDTHVNVSGEFFPANDSIHVEWEYLDVDLGEGPDDYVVTANGSLYTGL